MKNNHRDNLLSIHEMAELIMAREGMNLARKVKLRWLLTAVETVLSETSYRRRWQIFRKIMLSDLSELDRVYDDLRAEVRYRGSHHQFPSEWWCA